MTAAKHCSRCDLRFATETEMVWHLAHDHDEQAAQLARRLAATRGSRHELERRAHRTAVHRPPAAMSAGLRATQSVKRRTRGGGF